MRMKSFVTVVVLTLVLVVWQRVDWVHAQSSAPPRLDSEVSLDTGNSYGSTGIYARRFTNTDANVGPDITYTADATNGDSFTVNANGTYAVSYSDGSGTGDVIGISLNGSGATAMQGLAQSAVFCQQSMPAGTAASCSVTIELAATDVLRAHRSIGASLGANDSNTAARFIITKVR